MMNLLLMSDSHQTPASWTWHLKPRQAITLGAIAAASWLLVAEGRVWATRADGNTQAEDIWLGPGQSLALPAGSEWVLEGSPQASFSRVLAAPAPLNCAGEALPHAWWRLRWPTLRPATFL